MADAGLVYAIPPAIATTNAADRDAKGVANRLRLLLLLHSLACVDLLGFASGGSTGPLLPGSLLRLV